jgi:glycosyltransferase involved in cell wall biosynthesis
MQKCTNAGMQKGVNGQSSLPHPCIRAFLHFCIFNVMKVAIVNPVWDASASTPQATLDRFRSLTGWAEALRSAGAADVHVFQRFHQTAAIDRGDIRYHFVVDGVRPRPLTWNALNALCAAAAAAFPDVVHINGLDQPRLTRAMRRRVHASAIVVQDHGGFDPMTLPPWRRAWLRHGLMKANALLVATQGHKDVFIAGGLIPADLQIRDVMEASTRLRVGADAIRRDGLTLLFVGRLNRNKDPLTVLDAFNRFLLRRPDARMLFVYETGELESAMRAVLNANPALASRVSLVGAVAHEALPAIYAQADLFVLGSHHEGSGYAALEAMACGVIPVLTDIPSFRAMTGGARLGALWRPGDARSLVDALLRVTTLALQPQRDEVLAHFERRLSWEAIGRRALEIYREFSRA